MGSVEFGIVTSGIVKPIILVSSAVYANENGSEIVTIPELVMVQVSDPERVINDSSSHSVDVFSSTTKSDGSITLITESTGKSFCGNTSICNPVTLETVGLSDSITIESIAPEVAVYAIPVLIVAITFCELSLTFTSKLLVDLVLIGFSIDAKSKIPVIPELLYDSQPLVIVTVRVDELIVFDNSLRLPNKFMPRTFVRSLPEI